MSEAPEYDVALSFAGEDRPYVDDVAQILRERGVRVFYDKFEMIGLWGQDLYERLDKVYRKKARYTILFISSHYEAKAWTTHERRSAQARALEENREYVLPARFDDTPVPGLLPTVAYIDLREKTPAEFAEDVLSKLKATEVPSTSAGEKVSRTGERVRTARIRREKLETAEGLAELRLHAEALLRQVAEIAAQLNAEDPSLGLELEAGVFDQALRTPHSSMRIRWHCPERSRVGLARLVIHVYSGAVNFPSESGKLGYIDEPPTEMLLEEFHPDYSDDGWLWTGSTRSWRRSAELADHLLEILIDQDEKDRRASPSY